LAKAALIARNLADAGTVSASSTIGTLLAANLQTPHLARVWRSATELTSCWVLVDLGASTSVDFVALMATVLSGTATYRLRISTVDATGAAGDAYDSTATDADLDQHYPHLVLPLAAPVTGRYVRIDLADGAPTQFEAGRLIVGALYRPTHNLRRDYQLTFYDGSRVDESDGGPDWVERRAARRGIRASLPAAGDEEMRTYLLRMQIERGQSQDIGLMLDTASTNPGRDFFWGLAQGVRPIRYVALNRYDLEIEIKERA